MGDGVKITVPGGHGHWCFKTGKMSCLNVGSKMRCHVNETLGVVCKSHQDMKKDVAGVGKI